MSLGRREIAETLHAVADLTTETGYSPTVREIADRLGLGASATFWRLRRLRDLGLLDWKEGVARTIHLVDAEPSSGRLDG